VGKRVLEQHLGQRERLTIARAGVGTAEQLTANALLAAADSLVATFGSEHGSVRDGTAFDALVALAREELPDLAARSVRQAVAVLAAANDVSALFDRLVAPALADAIDDARRQLARLVRPGFVVTAGVGRLVDVERYVRGVERRLTRIGDDLGRDAVRTAECQALETRYRRLLDRLGDRGITAEVVELGWSLEELRIQQFAQTLGTKRSISVPKVVAELARLGG
jgi:ATP-dependent helicase HrpA